jgi:hypothetical protein
MMNRRQQQMRTNAKIKAGAAFVQVNKAWNMLEERHQQDVRTARFGSIEKCQITRSICRPLAAHIYDNLDTEVAGLGLGSALPSTPGYVGVYQFVAVSVLTPFGFSQSDAIAHILLYQAMTTAVFLFWGLLGLSRGAGGAVQKPQPEGLGGRTP